MCAEFPEAVDFRVRRAETACVPHSVRLPMPFRALRFAVLALNLAGCDRIKTALNPPQTDSVWQNDSTRLASRPTVLFRVDRAKSPARIIPIATIGEKGMRSLRMGDRGWRAFDLDYLYSSASFVPYRYGEPLAAVRSTRGMWEGAAHDTLPCPSPVPAALASLDPRVELLTSGTKPLSRPAVTALSPGELQAVLSTVNTLVVPTTGIPLSRLGSYKRDVYVLATGVSPRPTIVVVYDDPEALPDSATRITERPHHLMIVLDKGVYGYKPSYTYTDVSPSRIQPRRTFLGALDTDGDGKAELFFGVPMVEFPLVTYVYRFENDTWVESFKYERGRC